MKKNKFELQLGKEKITFEAKNLAEQANGNILARHGDTMVLATSVMSPEDKENLNFFPLTVEYEEKYYAAGKIKGARYIKREGRPSDEATCNARLIDRAIRPQFPKHLKREIQVVATVLSWDGKNDPDTLSLNAASISLAISNIPWSGPIAAVRIGKINNEFVLNPSYEEREKSEFDVVFAGLIKENELLINMIEGNFNENQEEDVLQAYNLARKSLKDLISFQKEIIEEIGCPKSEIPPLPQDKELNDKMKDFLKEKLENALYEPDKNQRAIALNNLKKELSFFAEEETQDESKIRYAKEFFEEEINRLTHENIIENDKRSDGRKPDQLREISCEAGILPRTHGSGLFSRGQTRSLSILTLGAPGDHQLLESMEVAGKKRFMHHYNFPPYSSGEVKPMRGPGRREIGHGLLAEKALIPLIPEFDKFPYTIRIVSEILSSNGSSSMAAVSSSSLALMDAGVPIRRPVAGIAMGLMKNDKSKKYKVLTDIQGPEDHHGDMDLKVAGTKQGITAIQMDVKIDGISEEIIKEALSKAKKARIQILEKIEETISCPREQLSPFAPRIISLQINPDKIREVIGPGGKVINEIIDKTGATIDIEDSGLIFITSEKEESAKKAEEWIKNITRELKEGETFQGRVKRIFNFGAFVEIVPGQEGLIHISKLSHKRVEKVQDVINIGDIVSVKIISIDEQGRINLSLLNNNKK